MQGFALGQVHGSYMGFMEFDGVRYWDVREVVPYRVTVVRQELPSDASCRKDLQLLA